ncbi:MAG: hypothetical protein C4320_05240 [Armatimonadota bacterium]
MQSKRRSLSGFTLIELLVVIAIIAILAAILFPVFAQAKLAAKKTAALSQAKQIGTSTILYTSDSDDQFPLGSVPNLQAPAVSYRNGDFTPQNPAGWFNPAGAPTAIDEYNLVWNNSIQPYAKNYDLGNLPGTDVKNLTTGIYANTTPQLKTPVANNLTYNGLLQYLSTTFIAAPSMVPMFWQGYGSWSNKGAAFLAVRLNCNGTAGNVCMYNAGGPPMPGGTGNPQIFSFTLDGPTYNVYSTSQVYVFTDSSARMVKYGKGNRASYPSSTNSLVPYQFIDDQGRIPSSPGAFYRGMGGLRGANYAAAFCPDNTFAN